MIFTITAHEVMIGTLWTGGVVALVCIGIGIGAYFFSLRWPR